MNQCIGRAPFTWDAVLVERAHWTAGRRVEPVGEVVGQRDAAGVRARANPELRARHSGDLFPRRGEPRHDRLRLDVELARHPVYPLLHVFRLPLQRI